MLFFLIAVLAGVFTVVAPCILPLLPIVIGASEVGERRISKRAMVVIGSLSLSVIVFTLLLKASTLFIAVPQSFWNYVSGVVIIAVGLAIAFPALWTKVPFVSNVSRASNKVVGIGYQKKSYTGDALIGLALGPVFTTCSPTYLYIIATILPAGFLIGVVYLLGFTLGLAVSLLCIAYFGQRLVNTVGERMAAASRIKQVFGIVIVIVGVLVLTGYDKKIETWILDSGYGATIQLEQDLIEQFTPNQSSSNTTEHTLSAVTAPVVAEAAANIHQTITVAGGCFWCTEAYFQEHPGIVDAVSGYAGGTEADASYLRIARGDTGHREAVQVTYDPELISLDEVLDVYWSHIDPTDTDGQFADTGFQYTTAIYYHTEEQKIASVNSKERLARSGLFSEPIATEIVPFTTFYEAEAYHQDYYKNAAAHYERYKNASGRAGFVEESWARDAARQFLEAEQAEDIDETQTNNGDYEYTDEEISERIKNLDPLAYHVVAESGTESPFNNAYWNNKDEGIYVDVVTGKPLFSSTHKYDSGTGWPSFWRTIDDDSVTLHEDNSLSTTRTEVRSDAGHVGHVFTDGPVAEGGRRFCTNSASLRFVPRENMDAEGYAAYQYLFM